MGGEKGQLSDDFIQDLSLPAHDINTLKHIHKLKGTASSIGCDHIVAHCKRIALEGTATEDDLSSLRCELKFLIDGVRKWVDSQ